MRQTIASLTAVLALSICCRCLSATDVVRRQISQEEGVVYATDEISVGSEYGRLDPHLEEIFVQARKGETNLLKSVRGLLEGESLEIQNYSAKLRGERLDLRIVSKVRGSPAKLRWVATLAGTVVIVPKGTIGHRGGELDILVFQKDGVAVVWFPDLGLPDEHRLSTLDALKDGSQFVQIHREREYSCTLKTGNGVLNLFEWKYGQFPSRPPDSDAIRNMNQFNRMSFNDLLTIFTNFKVAKPGYYLMESGK
jgi:hypothetical protein